MVAKRKIVQRDMLTQSIVLFLVAPISLRIWK